ncbi:MAG: aldehyde dehydrogenase family protein [Lysobacterales bacterium]|jgi:acyl-CoA reductase-like NAD-dependent aldehyde dehydrogenase|nr:MAG: aldehyde dehydrogenase family protein [Xanthomonadales bacterium]
MRDYTRFYIDGAWVAPAESRPLDVINPATEAVAGHISLGGRADVDRAVAAARRAFATFSTTSREERLALLDRIIAVYKRRIGDMAQVISEEMGAPVEKIAKPLQAPSGLGHFMVARGVLADFDFERMQGTTQIVREPVGVCGLITPWNWPANQIACKVAPALACGCTMVLKPSEIAPFSGHVLAEILHEAGVPPGVFNLVDGDGPTVGNAIASHPDVDMVSFTGSTRAGVLVDKAAADTVKKVSLELGGKSPNIILEGAPLEQAVGHGVLVMMNNTGQSCNAPSRMLVPRKLLPQVEAIAAAVAATVKVGDPASPDTDMGPQASEMQWRKVQGLIEQGVKEGAKVVAGGPGRPEGMARGFYTRPTIFSNVTNDMTIAREEIFGPVLCILPYDTEDEAVRIANDTPYGLSAYVFGDTHEHARRVGSRIRAGNVHINGASLDVCGSFGGYKQSGLGREWGAFGFEEFLEVKSVFGADPKAATGIAELPA